MTNSLSLPYNNGLPVPINMLDASRNYSQDNRQEPTPKAWAKERDGKGGKKFEYVPIAAFYRWLDEKYPGWSSEVIPESVHNLGDHVHVAVKLSVVEITGVPRVVTCYGADEAILKDGRLIAHPYLKSAESDALKRCVVKLGGFNDIYAEIDAEGMQVSAEDAKWYLEVIYPIAIAKIAPYKIFMQIKAFMSGLVTRKDLITFVEKMK